MFPLRVVEKSCGSVKDGRKKGYPIVTRLFGKSFVAFVC